MRCEVIQDLLSCYIDHTCSEETKKLVEEHLETCEKCRVLYNELSNVVYEIHPVIQEKRPFVKVKHELFKKILIIICSFTLAFIFLGSRITSTIVKERMNIYIKNHYAQYNLEMISFNYRDPEAQGFGVNNAYYVGVFTDDSQEDLTFSVYTEGFFLKLVDNFEYQINQRYSTVWRLVDNYSYDVDHLLTKEIGKAFISCSTGLGDETGYDYSLLELNQEYTRSIDQQIPIYLHIILEDLNNKEELVTEIVGILKENGFKTPILSISFINENGELFNEIPDIYHLQY